MYQLIILNPKVEDTGKYTIEIGGVGCTAFLNVDDPDPVYSFLRPLKKRVDGYTQHETLLECVVSSHLAIINWFRGDKKLEDGDRYSISKDMSGVCRCEIKNSVLEDSGNYSCRIDKQPENNITETAVNIIGTYVFLQKHSFSYFFFVADQNLLNLLIK